MTKNDIDEKRKSLRYNAILIYEGIYNGKNINIMRSPKLNEKCNCNKNIVTYHGHIVIYNNISIKNHTADEYFKEGKEFTDEEIAILSTMI